MKKSLITLLAIGLAGTAAQAQAPTWSGFKAGITLGASNYTNTWTDTDYDWYGGSLSYSKRKLAPAIHVGWDTQSGSVVFGIELDHSFNSAKRDVIYDTPIGNSLRVRKIDELKSVTTLRGRMGLTAGNALFYATAGVAKVKADHSWAETGDPTDSWPTFSNDHTGFVYGFGIEHRLNQMFSLRAEYQHVNIPETKSTNVNGYTMEVGEDVSTFAFGASFHF
jgi:outer membrane immunogenic protein